MGDWRVVAGDLTILLQDQVHVGRVRMCSAHRGIGTESVEIVEE